MAKKTGNRSTRTTTSAQPAQPTVLDQVSELTRQALAQIEAEAEQAEADESRARVKAEQDLAADILDQGGDDDPLPEGYTGVVSFNAKKGKGKRMGILTGKLPETTVEPLSKALADAILAKHIGHAVEEVTISAKVSGTGKDHKAPFDAFHALDADGMWLLSGGKIVPQTPLADLPKGLTDKQRDEAKRKGACDYFNYGRLLDIRAQVRGKLEDSIMGHEKAIDKQVRIMMDGNIFDTAEEAREHIIRQWKKGENPRLPADYVYPLSAESVETEGEEATA
jgi:hypothetical protein